MAKKIEINENWEPVEVEDLDNLFVVIFKQGSFEQGYVEAFDTNDVLMQSAYDSLAKQYDDCGCDESTKIYLIKVPNTKQTVDMCNTGLFNGNCCDPHVIEATRDLFNRADCEQLSCWEGCGLTEAKKKKKRNKNKVIIPGGYLTVTTGDPALNIKHFNNCMGTGGLQNPDAPHLVVGDTLPNGPVADTSSSDAGSGESSGEGGGIGESLKLKESWKPFDYKDYNGDEVVTVVLTDKRFEPLSNKHQREILKKYNVRMEVHYLNGTVVTGRVSDIIQACIECHIMNPTKIFEDFVEEACCTEEKINIDYVVSLFGDGSHYYKEDNDIPLSPNISGATKFNKKKDISILDIVKDICEYESKYMPENEAASLFDLDTLEEVYEKDEDYFINSGLVKIITVYKNKKINLPESLKEDTVIDDFPEPEGEPMSDKEIEEAMGIKEPEENK